MRNSGVSLREWCATHNIDLVQYLVSQSDADKYTYSSHVKLHWRCPKGHTFTREVMNMTSKFKFNCPACNGKMIIVGENDLATTRPDLAKDWDYEKNSLLPTKVTAGSHLDVWWKCSEGHSWKARISARDYGNGCPYCNGRSRTSIPEQILYYYIKKYFPDALNMFSINGVSYDIYIPSQKVVIEYDGSEWHRNKNTDYKFTEAKKVGFGLYKNQGYLQILIKMFMYLKIQICY